MHIIFNLHNIANIPDSKVHVANMGPTWVLSAQGGPHIGPMNLAIIDYMDSVNFGNGTSDTDGNFHTQSDKMSNHQNSRSQEICSFILFDRSDIRQTSGLHWYLGTCHASGR